MTPQEIMAQLDANKKKPAASKVVKRTTPRIVKVRTKKLGHMVGYCKHCGIYIGKHEAPDEWSEVDGCKLDAQCTRCAHTFSSCDEIVEQLDCKKEWMGPKQPWGDPSVPATFEHSANAIMLDELDMEILRHGNRSIL